jgi:LDH2 family malate/lactate/ureidoglycolate dehydrogenase
MENNVYSLEASKLSEYVKRLFEAIGTPRQHARLIAERLVRAHLRGHPSHGVIRIKQYMDAYGAGLLDPKAQPIIEVQGPCFANVKGNRSFGQVAASFAMETAIKQARDNGMSVVGCYDINHVGCLGDYVYMAVQEGFLGLAFCNGGGPNVAAFGTSERVLGVNPIAFGIPSDSHGIFVMDFTSGATAEGKLRVAKEKGQRVDAGLITDKDGKETTDPADFYEGGAIKTIGGHRGSALSIMIEILAGILPGGRCSAFDDYIEGNGVLFIVLKRDLFRSEEDVDQDVDLLYSAVTGAKKAVDVDRIWFPGELEEWCQKAAHEIVKINQNTWESIKQIGDSLDVTESGLNV